MPGTSFEFSRKLTASKLAWVKEYEPQIFGQVHKFMLPGDFIAMRMTGDIVTTVSGLSEGIFWDFRNNSVSEDLMSYFGFSKELVPDIRRLSVCRGNCSDRSLRSWV